MAKLTWSKKQLDLLRREYPICKDPKALALKLNKTYKAMASKAKVLKIFRGHISMWTLKMDLIMLLKYPNTTIPSLLPLLQQLEPGIIESSIASRAFKLGLNKSAQFKTEHGRYGRSLQGEAWNKGMKGLITHGSEKGWFKKGGKPVNTLYDGAIVTRHSYKERKSPPYKWIRLKQGKWEMLHVHIWKKQNGKVPAGHIIVFKDKNSLNVDINNLEMITLAENMRRNTFHKLPEELKPLIHLKAKLTRTINKKQKNEQGN